MLATVTKLPTPPHHYARLLEESQAENGRLQTAVIELTDRLDGRENVEKFLHREIDALRDERKDLMIGSLLAGTVNGVFWSLVVWLFG